MKKLGFGFPGQSDLQGHRRSDGKCFYIEVKLEDGEIRPEQREFIKAMRESNALARFCTLCRRCTQNSISRKLSVTILSAIFLWYNYNRKKIMEGEV